MFEVVAGNLHFATEILHIATDIPVIVNSHLLTNSLKISDQTNLQAFSNVFEVVAMQPIYLSSELTVLTWKNQTD